MAQRISQIPALLLALLFALSPLCGAPLLDFSTAAPALHADGSRCAPCSPLLTSASQAVPDTCCVLAAPILSVGGDNSNPDCHNCCESKPHTAPHQHAATSSNLDFFVPQIAPIFLDGNSRLRAFAAEQLCRRTARYVLPSSRAPPVV